MIFTGIFIFIILIVLKYTLFGSTQRINYTRIPSSDENEDDYCNNCFATLIQTHVKKRLDEEIENDPRNSPQSDEDILTEF
jgi:hypothetical protein